MRAAKRSVFAALVAAPVTEGDVAPAEVVAPVSLRGSLQLRHVDVGSCNGCEVEIAAAFGPVYDASRYGARLVASPRHADALLVTGVVTHNMMVPLRQTIDATPRPSMTVACGDCAIDGGGLREGTGVAAVLSDVVTVDAQIPGCPPHPRDIVATLRALAGR